MSKAWFSREELRGFKEKAIEESRDLVPHEDDGGDESCFRGLEHHISVDRTKRKNITVAAVLEVQNRLRSQTSKASSETEEILAVVARKLSQWAVRLARLAGHRDYSETSIITKASRKPCLKPSFHRRRKRMEDWSENPLCRGEEDENKARRVRRKVLTCD